MQAEAPTQVEAERIFRLTQVEVERILRLHTTEDIQETEAEKLHNLRSQWMKCLRSAKTKNPLNWKTRPCVRRKSANPFQSGAL